MGYFAAMRWNIATDPGPTTDEARAAGLPEVFVRGEAWRGARRGGGDRRPMAPRMALDW